jgi:hypothetical protein
MFSNPDFEVDLDSHEYKLLHPVERPIYRGDMLDSQFSALSDGEDNSPRCFLIKVCYF